MREIRFRGKRVDNRGWVYGEVWSDLEESKTHIHTIIHLPDSADEPAYDVQDDIEVIPSTVGQFTGLKDKNGKEIYEGDIVETKFNPRYVQRISWRGKPDATAEIFWDFNGFRLKAKGKEDERYADFWDESGWKMCDMSLKNTKIIGNIWENPELLREHHDC